LIQFNKKQLIDKKIDYNNNGITGVITAIMLNGIHLVIRDLIIEGDAYSIKIEHNFSFVKLHFEIEGDKNSTITNRFHHNAHMPHFFDNSIQLF